MKKNKILIVDDHAILREGLRMLLERENDLEIVGEAPDGKTAIEKSELLKPDIILLDVTLPDMNGFNVAKKILHKNPSARILILTMHEEPAYFREFIKIGIKGYVLKKAVSKELINAIKTVSEGNMFIHSQMAELLHEHKEKEKLSIREKEVLVLLAKGLVNKEIAQKLGLSIKTIETYRARLMKKLNVSGRSELTDYAIKTGILKL